MNNYDKLIAVTAGDPAGIGPDICLELSNHSWSNKIIVLTDPSILKERAKNLKKNIKITEWDPTKINTGRLSKNSLFVWPHYFKSQVLCGHPNSENSEIVLSSLNKSNICLVVSFLINGILILYLSLILGFELLNLMIGII